MNDFDLLPCYGTSPSGKEPELFPQISLKAKSKKQKAKSIFTANKRKDTQIKKYNL